MTWDAACVVTFTHALKFEMSGIKKIIYTEDSIDIVLTGGYLNWRIQQHNEGLVN